ncbi:uncharacterized protein BDZ99DRAFT_394738, partial [Mytilinidion resinicola]
SVPPPCAHKFKLLVSEMGSAVVYICEMCGSLPHWYIWECKNCKLKTCRPCAYKA